MSNPTTNEFMSRHLGSDESSQSEMLSFLGYKSMDALIKDCIPNNIFTNKSLDIKPAATESDAADELKK